MLAESDLERILNGVGMNEDSLNLLNEKFREIHSVMEYEDYFKINGKSPYNRERTFYLLKENGKLYWDACCSDRDLIRLFVESDEEKRSNGLEYRAIHGGKVSEPFVVEDANSTSNSRYTFVAMKKSSENNYKLAKFDGEKLIYSDDKFAIRGEIKCDDDFVYFFATEKKKIPYRRPKLTWHETEEFLKWVVRRALSIKEEINAEYLIKVDSDFNVYKSKNYLINLRVDEWEPKDGEVYGITNDLRILKVDKDGRMKLNELAVASPFSILLKIPKISEDKVYVKEDLPESLMWYIQEIDKETLELLNTYTIPMGDKEKLREIVGD